MSFMSLRLIKICQVAQVLKKGYKVSFENKLFVIKDANNLKVFKNSYERFFFCFWFNERGVYYKWNRSKSKEDGYL